MWIGGWRTSFGQTLYNSRVFHSSILRPSFYAVCFDRVLEKGEDDNVDVSKLGGSIIVGALVRHV